MLYRPGSWQLTSHLHNKLVIISSPLHNHVSCFRNYLRRLRSFSDIKPSMESQSLWLLYTLRRKIIRKFYCSVLVQAFGSIKGTMEIFWKIVLAWERMKTKHITEFSPQLSCCLQYVILTYKFLNLYKIFIFQECIKHIFMCVFSS